MFLRSRRETFLRWKVLSATIITVATALTLKKMCLACPSQWEGALDDGLAVYARFRHGHLTVGVGDTVEGAVDNAMSDKAL
jgi:hypothetical protein